MYPYRHVSFFRDFYSSVSTMKPPTKMGVSTPPVQIPHIKFVGPSAPTPSRTTNHEPRNLEMDYIGSCRGEANSRIPYVHQSKVTTYSTRQSVSLRLCKFPIKKFVGASAPTPSRTPHPAPRNLEIGNTGACRGEADSRIPNVHQSEVTTYSARQSDFHSACAHSP